MTNFQNQQRLWRRVFRPEPMPNHVPLPASGRAGRNLPAAVGSALILLAVLGVTLVFARPVFIGLVVVLVFLATWELAGAFARGKMTLMLFPLYLGGAAMVITGAFLGPFWILAVLYFTFALIVFWRLGSSHLPTKPLDDIVASSFTALYVPFAAAFVSLISISSETVWPIVFFVVVVACNDLGGWVAGVLFGRHPMTPKLSPKKTWEGLAGSLIFCLTASYVGTIVMGIPWWWFFPMGVAATFFGTAGDLLESVIKRHVGLKDMSNIVPGHGGLMDRLDSLLFAAPGFYIIFALAFGWFG